jgi:hypothetical protein
VAANAVDGRYSIFDPGIPDLNLTSTNDELNAWWQVDLGASFSLTLVDVWAREDCCFTQASNFDIQTSADAVTWTTRATVSGSAGRPTSTTISGAGRYVRIRKRSGTERLALVEVEVFGF